MADESITITQEQQEPYDYDSIWKDFTRDFWQDVLKDFMPDLYKAADLEGEAESLDKELHEIMKSHNESVKVSKRYVDNLLKIPLKNGGEEWVLFHIEIQGRGGEAISLRMFRYYCMLFTRYNRNPAALAILTAKRPKKEGEPGVYRADMFGTKIEYRYYTIRAYEYNDDELLSSDNPVKLFIYAVKFAAKNRKSKRKRIEYTQKILRVLTDKGWKEEWCFEFLKYLQVVMKLGSEEYRKIFIEETDGVLEGEKVRPRTLVDDIYDKGMTQGIEKEREEIIRSLFGLDLLTDEQIAVVTKQTPEDIAALRMELRA
ncbi:MAG: hypothetical protein IJU07_09050 [Synergistaceae bacterium]|nr:hypothetical protein [Synergistaceae bacterium]